ncbi:hypothetical protein [Acidobacterium capsulatum]|uniref:Conserved domain protein n=2 Tax=Acidobacterium TaxID=33973 RepID=C1F268_ACIC5|nr:hypothetical protein [Acidobacterium capsulatum]ACO34078.1 conserved domain protein [Acidobacterium capsulatum ATCC 51196]
MGRAAFLDRNKKLSRAQLPAPVPDPDAPASLSLEMLRSDERWLLAQRIAASRHFSRSPLLCRFLLYIVAETIEGRAAQITEHAIGVRVFDRPRTYRTVEDNIVRNYARQLRKRLADFYSHEGAGEACVIDIPLGGYVPNFGSVSPEACHETAKEPATAPRPVLAVPAAVPPSTLKTRGFRWAYLLALAVYTCGLAGAVWFVSAWAHSPHPARRITDPLWESLLRSQEPTYIVPSDSGVNLMEDLRHQALPLADYISGNYLNYPLHDLNPHTADDLRTQQYTSYADMQIAFSIEHLPQFDAQRDSVRFPRALHLDDLKTSNVILLGSEDSNPWASLAETGANFRIVDQEGMDGARIVNTHPRAGEQAAYTSHWNEPSHETYALMEYLPNMAGTGHLLLLQGLDVAGTEAAAEALLHPAVIAPVLHNALRPDGTLRSFEILLRSTSIASNAAGVQVVTSRVY